MVELLTHCPKTTDNVAKTFSVGQLGKGHAQKLIKTCKSANPMIAVVFGNDSAKLTFW
jgi:hypothetical protein